MPGDIVIVHDGVYREWVDPRRGGTCEADRIVYRAADGEKPVIKGSEIICGWSRYKDDVWRVTLDDAMFGDYNPYRQPLFGDWLAMPSRGEDPDKHPGMVFLNGRALYEVTSLEDTFAPRYRDHVKDYVTDVACAIDDPEMTQCVWYARVEDDRTVLYANFHGADPNEECVEIAVRRSCFFPRRHHVNYITVSGFELCQAATQWAPPTSHQVGAIGPNWATGWIIERNLVHDIKCSGISLGTSEETGDNEWYRTERKTGHQYQLEAVFKGLRIGWKKGFVGSHIVRDNVIYDCGQNAIVGHMGGAFSTIEHNHIYRIGARREFFGWEVAGIKFHAALDTQIHHNDIHDCSLGLWLDWQAQGTRVSSNVMHHNVRDVMIEVTHGPCLLDNNVFASPCTFQQFAQGTALVHNLIAGRIDLHRVMDRSTPYHFPHTTEVAGCAFVSGGDDRYYNNVFTRPDGGEDCPGEIALGAYAGYPTSMGDYIESIHKAVAEGVQGGGDPSPVQPLYVGGNAYCGVPVAEQETDAARIDEPLTIAVEESDDGPVVSVEVPAALASERVSIVGTADLGTPRIVEALYENPDGTPIVFDTDPLGTHRDALTVPGPFAALQAGTNRFVLPRREA